MTNDNPILNSLDPAVEITKLTPGHRIVYRYRGAPESVESGLYVDTNNELVTMTGIRVRFATDRARSYWASIDPLFVLEAVIPPALIPYRGMLLEDVDTKELWVYDPVDEGMEWVSSNADVRSEAYIAKRFAKGELVFFTPEVPA